MGKLKVITAALLPGILFFSCSSSELEEMASFESTQSGSMTIIDALRENDQHTVPKVLCATYQDYDLISFTESPHEPDGEPFGYIRINNSPDTVFIESITETGWYLNKAFIFAGTSLPPTGITTSTDLELFPYRYQLSSLPAYWVWTERLDQLPSNCNQFIFYGEIVQKSFFGGPIESTRTPVWAKGTLTNAGWAFEYCATQCPGDTVTVTQGDCIHCNSEVTVSFNKL